MDIFLILVAVAVASASISHTMTSSPLFESIRESLGSLHPKIDGLVHCPWCTGHYIALFIICILYEHILYLPINVFIHSILNWFTVVGLMSIFHYVIIRAYDPVAKAAARRELDKMNKLS